MFRKGGRASGGGSSYNTKVIGTGVKVAQRGKTREVGGETLRYKLIGEKKRKNGPRLEKGENILAEKKKTHRPRTEVVSLKQTKKRERRKRDTLPSKERGERGGK